MVDTINIDRFRNVTTRGHFFMDLYNIEFMYERYKFFLYMLDHYLQFLFESEDLCLLFFFLNKQRFIKHNNNIIFYIIYACIWIKLV